MATPRACDPDFTISISKFPDYLHWLVSDVMQNACFHSHLLTLTQLSVAPHPEQPWHNHQFRATPLIAHCQYYTGSNDELIISTYRISEIAFFSDASSLLHRDSLSDMDSLSLLLSEVTS